MSTTARVLDAFRRTVRLGNGERPRTDTFGSILGSSGQLVFLMVGLANDRGEEPTNLVIAQALGRSVSMVSKATAELVRSGWLVKHGYGFRVAS